MKLGITKLEIVKLQPDKDIAQMRRAFDRLHPKQYGQGVGPGGNRKPSAVMQASPGGADTVITIVPGGPGLSTTVSDGGGRKMTSARIYVIFWGDGWNSIPEGSPTMSDVLDDIVNIVNSPYLDGLQEYTPFSGATFESAYLVTGYNPPGDFTSADTSYIGWYLMAYGPIPESLDTIIFVMMPPGITNAVTGQHYWSIAPNLNTIPVAWVRYQDRAGISCTFSHELVESITDPDGSGIQVDPRSVIKWHELGDACDSLCGSVNGVTVQSYWSELAKACIIPRIANRIGVLEGTTLFVKEGNLDAPWVRMTDQALAFALSGNRVAALEGTTLFVKEGALDAPWVRMTDQAQDFALSGDRVAVLEGTTVFVKEGALDAPWVQLADHAQAFALSGDRVAALEGGTLFVKEGALDAPWVQMTDQAQAFALSGDRVAVLEGTTLFVKEGALDAPWARLADGAQAFALSGVRVAALEGTTLFVKEGALDAPWVQMTDQAQGFALSGNRVAVLEGTTLFVKEGALDAQWARLADGAQAFALSGFRVAALEGTTLFVKEGALDASWAREADGVQAFALL
ncbi:hypothetical protein ACLKMY_35645 [Paraburkholderia mimosarum]|uniref:hypothetical protein n=1 Tax=Paraburkholderia mimosarum TaxID=312026 RepID=UPI0039C02BB8